MVWASLTWDDYGTSFIQASYSLECSGYGGVKNCERGNHCHLMLWTKQTWWLWERVITSRNTRTPTPMQWSMSRARGREEISTAPCPLNTWNGIGVPWTWQTCRGDVFSSVPAQHGLKDVAPMHYYHADSQHRQRYRTWSILYGQNINFLSPTADKRGQLGTLKYPTWG
jgi:hypothetical protein